MDRDADRPSPLAVLGFEGAEEDLYRALLRHTPTTVTALAAAVGVPEEDVGTAVRRWGGPGLADLFGDQEIHTGVGVVVPKDGADRPVPGGMA